MNSLLTLLTLGREKFLDWGTVCDVVGLRLRGN